MPIPSAIVAADAFVVGRPLFSNQWLALLAVLAAIALLLAGVALLGRWLAATHPEPPPRPHPVVTEERISAPPIPAPDIAADVPPEIVPVLLTAVADVLGIRTRLVSIRLVGAAAPRRPNIEALMQEWSHEGRRQIYSSHKVR
jgi:hypothetical protein